MKRILLAEDNELLLLALRDILELEGYEVLTAENGLRAWVHLQQHAVDLVITNYIMPKMNGLDLLQRIRADSRYAAMPVIGFSAGEFEAEFLAQGADSFLQTPFTPEVLINLVRDCLDGARSPRIEGALRFVGQAVHVKIDRPLGSRHPDYGFIYPLNYGFVPGVPAPDGEDLDAYVLGVFEPVEAFTGHCIAIIHRLDDDDKLIVVPEGKTYSEEQILALTEFQERFAHAMVLY